MRAGTGTLLVALFFVLGCGDSTDPYEGRPEHVQKRHLNLEGAPNFRDLGGYTTEDGREVKWGLFFRSDNLHDLTDADLAVISELGIQLVCDFRSPTEREEEPDRLPENSPPQVAELAIWDPAFAPESFREKLSSGNLDGVDLGEFLVEGNRLFATQFYPLYAQMFARITQRENLPVVVHCTAGKDRAGFAAALILRVLGVPMETVYEDYLLTNVYTADKIERTLAMARVASLFQADGDQLRSIMGAERRFLQAAFEEIDKRYGSFENYRRDALGISDSEQEAFREMALESR